MPSEKYERQCAVVLGMHRSGTSALSGVLAHLGCGTPRSIAPADENNQRGYFESIPLWKLSEDILEAAGSKWDDWRPVSPEAFTPEQWAAFSKRAQWVLNHEFQDQPLFVLKDPRMCRLLSFWLPEIQAFGYQAHFVLTYRHPMEVAASLARRNDLVPEYGLLMWLHYVLQAERATRSVKRVFISYNSILKDWRQVVDQMRAGLDLTLPVLSDESAATIDDFLSAKLRRFEIADGMVQEGHALPVWVQRCHEIFESWTQAGEDPDDHAELDRIAHELTVATPAFETLVEMTHAAIPAQIRAAEDLAAAEAETCRLQNALSVLQSKFDNQSAELLQTAGDLKAVQATLKKQQTEHAQEIVDQTSKALQAFQQQQDKLEKIAAERDSAWQEHQETLEQVRNLKCSLDAAIQQSAMLEHVNIVMSQSTSWRVTQPLRRLGQLVKIGKHTRNHD